MTRLLRHARTRARLDAYADVELGGADLAAVERHLDECPECRGTLAVIRDLKLSLRRLGCADPGAVARLRRWARTVLCESDGS